MHSHPCFRTPFADLFGAVVQHRTSGRSDLCMPVLLYLSVPLSFGPPAASFSHRLLLHGHSSYLGSGCPGVRLVLLCVIAFYGSRALPRRVLIRVAFLTGCSCMSSSCLGPSSFVKLPSVLFFVPLVDSLPCPLLCLSPPPMACLFLCGARSRSWLFLLCVHAPLVCSDHLRLHRALPSTFFLRPLDALRPPPSLWEPVLFHTSKVLFGLWSGVSFPGLR